MKTKENRFYREVDAELLPCPFCGSALMTLQNLVDDDDWYVSCDGCDVQQIADNTRGDAVIKWNTRAKPLS